MAPQTQYEAEYEPEDEDARGDGEEESRPGKRVPPGDGHPAPAHRPAPGGTCPGGSLAPGRGSGAAAVGTPENAGRFLPAPVSHRIFCSRVPGVIPGMRPRLATGCPATSLRSMVMSMGRLPEM